jgi:hypothetical protein
MRIDMDGVFNRSWKEKKQARKMFAQAKRFIKKI